VTSLTQLNQIIATNRCVVVEFFSTTCGLCKMIAPEFERLVRDSRSADGKHRIMGVKVDAGVARDVAAKFEVSAMPQFTFFLDGQKV
ncbi:thioredoxin domain-containing protein, partial [Blyttiomyces helicus]